MVRFQKLLRNFLLDFFFLYVSRVRLWQSSYLARLMKGHHFPFSASKYIFFFMFPFCWVDRKSMPSVEGQQHQVWGSELNFVLWMNLSALMHERLWFRDCGILGLLLRPPLTLARLHTLAETLIWIHFTWKRGTKLPFHGGKLLKAWFAIQLCV